jgi:hypothetical protein
LRLLERFAAAVGLGPDYEPLAGCQAYPAYVAWLALNGSPADVALAFLANLESWGRSHGAGSARCPPPEAAQTAPGLRRTACADAGGLGHRTEKGGLLALRAVSEQNLNTVFNPDVDDRPRSGEAVADLATLLLPDARGRLVDRLRLATKDTT